MHRRQRRNREWLRRVATKHVIGKAVDVGPAGADDWLIRKLTQHESCVRSMRTDVALRAREQATAAPLPTVAAQRRLADERAHT